MRASIRTILTLPSSPWRSPLPAVAAGGSAKAEGGRVTLILGAYTTPREAYGKAILPAFRNTGSRRPARTSSSRSPTRAAAPRRARSSAGSRPTSPPSRSKRTSTRSPTRAHHTRLEGAAARRHGHELHRRDRGPHGKPQGDPRLGGPGAPGLDVLTPDPKTSGGALWNINAALRRGASRPRRGRPGERPGGGRALPGQRVPNVSIMDKGARESITNFERGVGDVAITYENEVLVARTGRAGVRLRDPELDDPDPEPGRADRHVRRRARHARGRGGVRGVPARPRGPARVRRVRPAFGRRVRGRRDGSDVSRRSRTSGRSTTWAAGSSVATEIYGPEGASRGPSRRSTRRDDRAAAIRPRAAWRCALPRGDVRARPAAVGPLGTARDRDPLPGAHDRAAAGGGRAARLRRRAVARSWTTSPRRWRSRRSALTIGAAVVMTAVNAVLGTLPRTSWRATTSRAAACSTGRRPAVRDPDARHRRHARRPLRPADGRRLVADRARPAGHLRQAGHRAGAPLRLLPVRRPHGAAGPPRRREEPGGGGLDAGRLGLDHLPARGPARRSGPRS